MKHLIKITLAISFLLIYTHKTKAQTYFSSNTVGENSSALGSSNTSIGEYSFASGSENHAKGVYSSAKGFASQAFGSYSASTGAYSYANGYISFAIGNRSKALGYEAYSIGSYAQATGSYAVSIGRQSITSGTNAYTFGYYSGGTGANSFSIGNYAEGNGANSLALGSYVKTSNSYAFTIGRGINSTTKLENNQTNTLMVGFNSDIATLYVGASAGVGTTGNVGIGTTDTQGYKLAVKGSMIAEEMFVKLYANWPDYVFAEEYELKSLAEVEAFIQENNHLPNVPSEKEVKEEGINLGEMNAILLQKIEELTLYTIQQEKKSIEQQQQLDKQSKLIQGLLKANK